MPRDGAGNYTLPAGNPVTSGTVIEAAWANPTLSDIAAALTDSLSRSGSGGMLVPFRFADGTMAAPGASWVNEPSSGWYRAALQDFWYSVGNENIFRITKTGIELAAGKIATGISSFTRIQDADPSPIPAGQEWFESDTGGLYLKYQNPDLTFSWILINGAVGGGFIPLTEKGAVNGVATLDVTGKVPASQLPAAVPFTLPGALRGLTLANNAGDLVNDIDIATGSAASDVAPSFTMMTLAAALIKRLDANWAPGTNQGMRNSAVAIADTTYHLYLVGTAAGVIDIYAHTSAVVATALAALQVEPGGATYVNARRIGSILRVAGAIVPFVQDGDLFQRITPAADVAAANPGVAAVTRTLSVPLGINVIAIVDFRTFGADASGASYAVLSDLATADVIPSVSNSHVGGTTGNSANALGVASQIQVRTNTAGQVRSRIAVSVASTNLYINTRAWIDTRGKG